MKTKLLLLFFSISPLFAMGQTGFLFFETRLDLTFMESDGTPVEGAEVSIWFKNPKEQEASKVPTVGLTDVDGKIESEGIAPLGINIRVKKEGYYQHGYFPGETERVSQTPMPKKVSKDIILRPISNPKPLYVKYKGGGVIPIENEWAGYDLEKGDWVKPHGIGETVDILFRYQNEFREIRELASRTMEERRASYQRKCDQKGIPFTEEGFMQAIGKWDGSYQIAFPGEKEGILKVEEDFIPESILPMPNSAPESGYLEEYNEFLSYEDSLRFEKDLGFFLRTRVVLNERGEIESANYTKIHGEFRFSTINGFIGFNYYYNPNPNDRNLEYNGENLFSKNTPGIKGITGYR